MCVCVCVRACVCVHSHVSLCMSVCDVCGVCGVCISWILLIHTLLLSVSGLVCFCMYMTPNVVVLFVEEVKEICFARILYALAEYLPFKWVPNLWFIINFEC